MEKEINIKGYISEQELSETLKTKIKTLDDLSAEKIKVKDITNVFTNDNVEDALFECANKINKLEKNVDDAKNKAEQAFQEADNGKKLIASAVGSPLSANDEFSTMSTKIQTMKNNFVENLNTKGQSASKNEELSSLINKIALITNKKVAYGTPTFNYEDESYTVSGLGFYPNFLYIYYADDYFYNNYLEKNVCINNYFKLFIRPEFLPGDYYMRRQFGIEMGYNAYSEKRDDRITKNLLPRLNTYTYVIPNTQGIYKGMRFIAIE